MYRKEVKELVIVAVPLVLAQVAQNTISFVDTIMVGRLGKEALAGIAIGSTLFQFILIVLSGVIIGVSPIVSQATGAKDDDLCGRATRQGLWIGVLLFTPAFLLYRNAYPLLIWFNQSPETALASSEYLKAISWGLLPALWIMGLRGLLEGKSNTKPIMVISLIGVALNVFANDALMFGHYGLPKLGLVGTGYASSLVYGLVFLAFSVYVSLQYSDLQIFSKLRRPDFSTLKEVARVGGPIGMTLAFEAGMFGAAAFAMGTIGETQLAAHQIALQTASISFMIPLGLAIATSVRVGQAIGAGSPHRAEVAGHAGMLLCIGVMSISGLIFWLLPLPIIGMYIDIDVEANAPVVAYAISFLALAALFQVVDGLQVAASGSLRGIKDTKAAMALTLVSYWLVGCVVGAYLCFGAKLEGVGLWIGMTSGLATAAVLLTLRFQFKMKALKQEHRLSAPTEAGAEAL
ncbi:MATE family efflux transporter [Mariniblastus sp.]|nr:MATE family efflux transporter [Mariniblastus sp.]MDC0284941.1 MATE family efflux transporter [Mariniblastus sp.]